jgi:Mrp family chromosome partitioning ATPase/capsular polysaccharide biosynthesis protein
MSNVTAPEGTPAAKFVHYLHVLRRRLWIFLVPLVLAPLVAVLLTVQQPSKYEATAAVLLSHLNLAQSLNGLPVDQSLSQQPDRAATTQANIARSPDVATRAIRAAHASMSADALLASSSVDPENNADLLDFHVTNHNTGLAIALANAYARAFSQFSNELETGPLETAFKDVTTRLTLLRKQHRETSPLYADLLDKQQRIVALETLQTSSAVVVRPARTAVQVAPRPKRAFLLGFGLGLLVALALVFVAEALDPRIRNEEEIEASLNLPLLARIPPAGPGSRQSVDGGIASVHYGGRAQAEAFRQLRTSLAFVALNRELRVLLVTSPRPGDGKTTTAANLAIAFARSGQDVVLCDLDAHSPTLAEAMALPPNSPGMTDVVLGRKQLDEALVPVDFRAYGDAALLDAYGLLRPQSGESGTRGRLNVLGFGTLRPPDPGEFVGTRAVHELLKDLRSRVDLVIVDSAPLLNVGDALMLGAHVDGSLIVIRATAASRADLAELARLLEHSPTQPVGFVLTDARSRVAAYGYGYGSGLSEPFKLESFTKVAER